MWEVVVNKYDKTLSKRSLHNQKNQTLTWFFMTQSMKKYHKSSMKKYHKNSMKKYHKNWMKKKSERFFILERIEIFENCTSVYTESVHW